MITLHCRPAGVPPGEITIGHRLLEPMAAAAAGRTVVALCDRAVPAAARRLPPQWRLLEVDGGEALKSFANLEAVLRQLARWQCDRGTLLVCIGGGSLGDLGGLCAALFLRGIEHWQVPTTLLAMVDSGIGGKTAIDLPEGKNLVGAVHPATRTWIDLDLLAALPEPQFRSGLAEALKMAIGCDAELFGTLETQRDAVMARQPALLQTVVQRSVQAKIDVVEGDLREQGPRRVLNLGHTLGHALEAHAGGRIPHGLCVAQGLHFALDRSERLGVMPPQDLRRCRLLLDGFGFARTAWPPAAELAPFLARDKKVLDGDVHFVLPTGIGRAEVRPIALHDLLTALPDGSAGD